MKLWTVVPAAGQGRRFAAGLVPGPSDKPFAPKQYWPLHGRTVLEWALAPFLARDDIERVVVVISADDEHWSQLAVSRHPRVQTVLGGAERAASVRKGVMALVSGSPSGAGVTAAEEDWVLVHDAARPCLTPEDLQLLLAAVRNDAVGGLLATPLADTLKRAAKAIPASTPLQPDSGRADISPRAQGNDTALRAAGRSRLARAQPTRPRVAGTVPRTDLWRALTPQMFRHGVLTRALDTAAEVGTAVTDESSAVELLGLQPMLVPGRADNLKITQPQDLALAGQVLDSWRAPLREVGK